MALNSFAFDCLRTTFDLYVASQYDMYEKDYEIRYPVLSQIYPLMNMVQGTWTMIQLI